MGFISVTLLVLAHLCIYRMISFVGQIIYNYKHVLVSLQWGRKFTILKHMRSTLF